MCKTHKLKTVQPFYDDVIFGKKLFEVRLNDRDYHVGDYLVLQEYHGKTKRYTGRETERLLITYILDSPEYCKDGYVVMGFRDIPF